MKKDLGKRKINGWGRHQYICEMKNKSLGKGTERDGGGGGGGGILSERDVC